MSTFKIEILYCYPTSDMAAELGRPKEGGFYAQVGTLIRSPLFRCGESARGWLRNRGLPVPPCDPGCELGRLVVGVVAESSEVW